MIGKRMAGTRGRVDQNGKRIVTRLSLHEQVADQLRQMIVTGELAAGEKLRLAELAAALEVSPTPLREALKVLAAEQLVDLTPNRGARVAPITVSDTRQLFDVIAGIEALAAEAAALRRSPEELSRLEELHAAMRACHEAGDSSGYFDLNREIHDFVVSCAGNPILSHIREGLARRAERARYLSVASAPHRDEAMEEHEALMAALRSGDAERAHRVWRHHLLRSGAQVCDLVAARDAREAETV